jgi:hypothetical protein
VNEVKVLLTDTNRWTLSARLGISLAQAGFEVAAVCPSPHHPLRKTRAVNRLFSYDGFHPVQSIATAIAAFEPHIVIPACDRSVAHLHELYTISKTREEKWRPFGEVIERSLGDPHSHSTVSSRFQLLEAARDAGVRVPRMCRVDSVEEFKSWQETEPYPWILKADGTWGGEGIRTIETHDQIGVAEGELGNLYRFRRGLKRLVVNRDRFWLHSWWTGARSSIIAQAYIPGRPANCTAVAWNGRILAAIAVEVIASDQPTSPARIVRILENSEMITAAQQVADKLGLSGFFGLDFMIDERSGDLYLIEMNPRVTPPSHLRLDAPRDLPGALWSELTGEGIPAHSLVTSKSTVGYFPQSSGIAASAFQDYYLDIPVEEPELIRELLSPYPDRTLLYRITNRFTRRQPSSQPTIKSESKIDASQRVSAAISEACKDTPNPLANEKATPL